MIGMPLIVDSVKEYCCTQCDGKTFAVRDKKVIAQCHGGSGLRTITELICINCGTTYDVDIMRLWQLKPKEGI